MLYLVVAASALVEPPLLVNRASAGVACVQPSLARSDVAAPLSRRALLSTAAGVVAAGALPSAVFAESTLVTRQQAYTRYVPRIERGRDYWANGLKKSIANGDWTAIQAQLTAGTKKTAGGAIAEVFNPMSLWSSSWSSKVISDKTYAMNAAIDELREAAASLEVAAYGKQKESGFFGVFGMQKSLSDDQRKALAIAAYKKGVSAFNKYVEIGNDGLGLNFAPLDTID